MTGLNDWVVVVQDVSQACAVVGIPNINMTPLNQEVPEDHHQRIAGLPSASVQYVKDFACQVRPLTVYGHVTNNIHT